MASLRFTVGAGGVRVRIDPATCAVRLVIADGRLRATVAALHQHAQQADDAAVAAVANGKLRATDGLHQNAQQGDDAAVAAVAAPQRRVRPAPALPPRVKTAAELRLDAFNDERWDSWRARTASAPRPPLSTHGGNETWRKDRNSPPPPDPEATFKPRVHLRPRRGVPPPPPAQAALRAERRAQYFAPPAVKVEQHRPAFKVSGKPRTHLVPRTRESLAEPNLVRRFARAWEQMAI